MDDTEQLRAEGLEPLGGSTEPAPNSSAESVEAGIATPARDTPSDSSGVTVPHPQTVLGPHARMQDLADLVLADPGLSDGRRGNVACSIRKFVEHMGLDLHMRADFMSFRNYLKRFNPASARIAKRRWSNITSDVKFALERYRAASRRPTPKDLTPEWRAARDSLPTTRMKRGLSRFIHWASTEGISPAAVDDAVMHSFHQHLTEETFAKKPDRIYRDTTKLWNQTSAEVERWPDRTVTVPSFRNIVSLPLADFPLSFQEALEAHARRLAGRDLTAPDLQALPLEPSTIEQHVKLLRRFASAMVRTGRPIEEIDGLAPLFEAPWFETALQAEFDRLGGTCPSLQELAATLLSIARHHLDLPATRIEEIRRIKQRLKCRARGFTDKNRERLRPFTDPAAQARFLHLGDKLVRLSARAGSAKRAALLVQTALAHELLIAAPMRFGNLVGLGIKAHLRFTGSGRTRKVFVVIPDQQVKNDIDLEFALPANVARLLRLYLERHRPVLLQGLDEGWLFPGEKPGTHKHQVTLSGQLVMAVRNHAGLTVNPHLYRHVAAYFYLQERPGDFETVRRLLGHKSIETTTMFYADFDRALSIARYQETVLERKEQLGASARRTSTKDKTGKTSER